MSIFEKDFSCAPPDTVSVANFSCSGLHRMYVRRWLRTSRRRTDCRVPASYRRKRCWPG